MNSGDLSRVTLVYEEELQVQVHKVILAATSPAAGMEEAASMPAVIVESLLLSAAHYWSTRETMEQQVELVERHFRQDEMYHALSELKTVKPDMPALVKRQQTVGKTATRSQAEDVVKALKELGDKDNLPRFMVQSDDLHRILPLLGAVSVGDERGVGARLEALEVTQRRNMEEMKMMVNEAVRAMKMPMQQVYVPQQASVPDVTVTRPNYATVTAGAGGSSQNMSFLQRPSRGEGGGRARGRQDRTPSLKRVREGEEENQWREVTRRKPNRPKPKTAGGTAVLADFSDLSGPAEFWIGNTHPSTTKEKVTLALTRCAENLKIEQFSVEDVHCLTKDENPRTKTWKVTVPARLKDTMENPAMYLAGWSHRVFSFRPRRAPAGAASEGGVGPQEGVAASAEGAGLLERVAASAGGAGSQMGATATTGGAGPALTVNP